MIDIDKLIDTLKQHGVSCVRSYGRYCSICDDAATALSTLQGENSQLRESRDHWKRLAHELNEGVNGKDAEHERLQAENEKLKDQLYDGEGVNLVNYWMQQAKIEENGHRNCQAENEKLRAELENYRNGHCSEGGCAAEKDRDAVLAELEQVKAEKDAAVESIPHECKTCVYHTVFFNGCTLDHDCTNPDGGCSNNYDRWKWRGQKED